MCARAPLDACQSHALLRVVRHTLQKLSSHEIGQLLLTVSYWTLIIDKFLLLIVLL